MIEHLAALSIFMAKKGVTPFGSLGRFPVLLPCLYLLRTLVLIPNPGLLQALKFRTTFLSQNLRSMNH